MHNSQVSVDLKDLSNNNIFHLRIFYQGLVILKCVDIVAPQCDRYQPSSSAGAILKKNHLKKLKRHGLIDDEFVIQLGIKYISYSISELGRKTFEEYQSANSK